MMSNIRIQRSTAANHSCAYDEQIESMLRIGTLQKPNGDLEKLPTHAAYDGNFVNVTESNQKRTRINRGRFRGGLPDGAIFRGRPISAAS